MSHDTTRHPGYVLAIDPGDKQSAYVKLDLREGKPFGFGKLPNGEGDESMLDTLRMAKAVHQGPAHLAIEMIASYGMPVGREVFETCVWIGRFIQAWGEPVTLIYRREVKLHLCQSVKANDANIRQALIDRFGPGKEVAIGRKKNPGPLYGMNNDERAALAVAVTYADKLGPAHVAVQWSQIGGGDA